MSFFAGIGKFWNFILLWQRFPQGKHGLGNIWLHQEGSSSEKLKHVKIISLPLLSRQYQVITVNCSLSNTSQWGYAVGGITPDHIGCPTEATEGTTGYTFQVTLVDYIRLRFHFVITKKVCINWFERYATTLSQSTCDWEPLRFSSQIQIQRVWCIIMLEEIRVDYGYVCHKFLGRLLHRYLEKIGFWVKGFIADQIILLENLWANKCTYVHIYQLGTCRVIRC